MDNEHRTEIPRFTLGVGFRFDLLVKHKDEIAWLEVVVMDDVLEMFLKLGNGNKLGLDYVIMNLGEIFVSFGKLTRM
jgi:hypothetical protein